MSLVIILMSPEFEVVEMESRISICPYSINFNFFMLLEDPNLSVCNHEIYFYNCNENIS